MTTSIGGTFHSHFWRLVAIGCRPEDAAGTLIHYACQFSQGGRPEGEPPSDRDEERHFAAVLKATVEGASFELRYAGFLPVVQLLGQSSWSALIERYARWFDHFAGVVRSYDPGELDDDGLMLRGLWCHLQHEASRLGIVDSRAMLRRLRNGLHLAGRCDKHSPPEEVLAEFYCLTWHPHKTLFRWSNGKLDLCSWRVKDGHPLRVRGQQRPAVSIETPVGDDGIRLTDSLEQHTHPDPREHAEAADQAAQLAVLRATLLGEGGATAAAYEHVENRLLRRVDPSVRKLSRRVLAKRWDTTADRIRRAGETTITDALEKLQRSVG